MGLLVAVAAASVGRDGVPDTLVAKMVTALSRPRLAT